jgi:hypothetical protein
MTAVRNFYTSLLILLTQAILRRMRFARPLLRKPPKMYAERVSNVLQVVVKRLVLHEHEPNGRGPMIEESFHSFDRALSVLPAVHVRRYSAYVVSPD